MKDHRVRINKRMVAWSNGQRVNMTPAVRQEVDANGTALQRFYGSLREGDEHIYGIGGLVRAKCRCLEADADALWEQGKHLYALNSMIDASMRVLPDEGVDIMYEDMQWLDPDEVPYWHPNIREFMRLMRRCEGYCKQDPRLWPILNDSHTYRDYRRYLDVLNRWVHEA